jgi:hypothetical protein
MPISLPGSHRVIDYGYDKPSHSKALVLELLGADIQSMRKKSGGRLSIKTTLLLALQLVCILNVRSVSLIFFFLRFLRFGISTPKALSTEI